MPRRFPSRLRKHLIVTVALVAAACTGTGPEPGPPREATPITGGNVDFGVIGSPPTLHPLSNLATDLTRALAVPLYPKLFAFEPGGTVVPDLAASLEVAGTSAVVRLADREWSNGRRIKASDVVASARLADPPSGFSGLDARVLDRGTVEFRGQVESWEERLARATFVLPRGRFRPHWMASGPFEIGRYEPGLKLVLERSATWAGDPALLDRIRVWFVESLDIALELLERGRLDAAWLPSSVNLDERLDEMGLAHGEALGHELVAVRFNRERLTRDEWIAIARRIDREELEEGFVRDDGRLSNTLHPAPCCWDGGYAHLAVPGQEPPEIVKLAAPSGDQLLGLMQRAIQVQLERRGIDTELVVVPADLLYGRWRAESPVDAALIRTLSAPGMTDPRPFSAGFTLPLAQVETVVVWRGVGGLAPNPTIEGPLWNAASWFRNSGGL